MPKYLSFVSCLLATMDLKELTIKAHVVVWENCNKDEKETVEKEEGHCFIYQGRELV